MAVCGRAVPESWAITPLAERMPAAACQPPPGQDIGVDSSKARCHHQRGSQARQAHPPVPASEPAGNIGDRGPHA